MAIFDDGELDGLWDEHPFGYGSYTEASPSDGLVAEIEAELGYRLPAAFVELSRVRNGGTLERNCFPTTASQVWSDDHVAVVGLYAIGRTSRYSLCGELGSAFMLEEWGYPPIGVCFADTPTAGHSVYMFDYRGCGPDGEPAVVIVDQENDYRIDEIAPNFATFIRGLVPEDDLLDHPAELEAIDLAAVEHGTLSPIVRRGIDAVADRLPEAEAAIRELGRRIVRDKGGFALHADPQSHLMYTTMFWLLTRLRTPTSREDFIDRLGATDYERPCYELMIPTTFVADPYGFTTAGWARGFVDDWWDAAVAQGNIVQRDDGWVPSDDLDTGIVRVLRALAARS